MAIPAGYTLSQNGFYYYTDGSGPYAIGQDGTPQLAAGTGGISGGGSLAVSQLLSGVTGNATGAFVARTASQSTFQATVAGSGAIGCTVTLQGSNDGVTPCGTALAVITLSGTDSASDGFALDAPWPYVRAVVSGSSGTISAITCSMALKS